jgi:hypothetical protein
VWGGQVYGKKRLCSPEEQKRTRRRQRKAYFKVFTLSTFLKRC